MRTALSRQRIGIDVVPLERIRQSLEAEPSKYAARFLTQSESLYCQGPRIIERLAGRIAAKEAVMKLLGDGWPNVAWTDIEVVSSGEAEGHLPKALTLATHWPWQGIPKIVS